MLASVTLSPGEDFQAYLEARPEFVEACYLSVTTRDCNAAAVALFEAENRQHLIENRDHLAHAATRSGFPELLIDIFEGRSAHESQVRRKTFKGNWVDVITGLVFATGEEGLKNVVVVVRDVTAQNQAFAIAKENEARLKKAETIANVGNWSFNFKTRQIRWSAGIYQLAGIEPGAIDLNYRALLERIHPEDRALYRTIFGDLTENSERKGYEKLIFRIIRPNGEHRVLHITFEIERGPDRKPLRYFGTALDVTEVKAAEAELRHYQNHLEEMIADRTVELKDQIEEVEQLNRVLQETNRKLEQTARELSAANQEMESFSYTVSHDLRSPLRHINGYLGILLSDHLTNHGPEIDRLAKNIVTATQQMGQLIDDLLSFSQTGRSELAIEQIELRPLADRIIKEHTPADAQPLIEWIVGDLPIVRADASLLQVVFHNLITNAVKYSSLRTQPRIEIRQADASSSDETILFVRDNGVGFDAKYTHKLFGVFERLHKTEDYEGNGIGLATVRRIIHAHGGIVWADSTEEQGATFFFSLPTRQSV